MTHNEAFRALLAEHGLGQSEAARMLSRATGDEIDARTVRRWLADASLPSARPCPGWPVYILRWELAIRRLASGDKP